MVVVVVVWGGGWSSFLRNDSRGNIMLRERLCLIICRVVAMGGAGWGVLVKGTGS